MPFTRIPQAAVDSYAKCGDDKDLRNFNRAIDILAKIKFVNVGGKVLDQHAAYKSALQAAEAAKREFAELVRANEGNTVGPAKSLVLLALVKTNFAAIIDRSVADLKKEKDKRFLP